MYESTHGGVRGRGDNTPIYPIIRVNSESGISPKIFYFINFGSLKIIIMYRYIVFLILLASSVSVSAQKIELLYFTDAHRIFPVDDVEGGRGGVARLKTVVDQIKSKNPNTLVIHGGDLCGGVLFGGMYRGMPMIEAFNKIPVDISNFGQHEFDFGVEHTLKLIQESKFQWFSSNLKERDGSVFANLPLFLVKKINGLTVGFIGLTDAMNTTMKSEVVLQEKLSVALSEVISKIGKIDFLVVLTQTGLDVNRMLLDKFPGIDIILTEEQYEYESNVFYSGSIPIVSTAGNMSSVAHICLEKDKNTDVNIIPLNSDIKSEKALEKMELYYKKDMESRLSEKISHLEFPLNFIDGIKGESAAGNLVSDAFREWHDADVGLINGGGIRADIPAGELTLKGIRSILPFGNKICQISIKGIELKRLLKRYAGDKKGQLLHVSGIRYEYFPVTDSVSVIWRDKELVDDKWLTVALNNYLLNKLEAEHRVLIDESHAKAVEDFQALRSYCLKRDRISPEREGRIEILMD